jgi:MFS family permease
MRQSNITRLIACLLLMSACIVTLRITASLWVLQAGMGEWAVGLLLMTMSLAPLWLSIWAGHLTDRIGFKRPSQIAIVLTVVGAMLPVLSTNIWSLALACLIVGGGVSMNAVALQHVIGSLSQGDADLRRIYGWVALAPALAGATVGVSAGLLIDHVGFSAAFFCAAVLPTIALWLVHVEVPTPHKDEARPITSVWSAFKLFRMGAIRMVLLVNLLMAVSWDAHSFVVPIVGHFRSLTATEIGLVLSSFSAATVVVRIVIIRWSTHITETRVIQIAALVAGAGFATYQWLPTTLTLMVGSAVIGLALGSVQPMLLSAIHQVTPEGLRGQALGLRMFMMHIGTVGMPLIFAMLTQTLGSTAPMNIMAFVLLAMALALRFDLKPRVA